MLTTSTITIEQQARQRAELYAIHRNSHRDHFSDDGAWQGPLKRDGVNYAREWLWHAFAFLAGDEDDQRLGNAIVSATPNLGNHFNPIAAAQLMLHYQDVLEPRAAEHLIRIINDGFAEAVDYSLAITGVNNFSCMRAFFFLAASQIIETYEVSYAHRSMPEVYNRFRMRQFGRNVLELLEAQLVRTDLSEEFNSPNYSPISLLAMAEIVNLIEDEPAREAAARIERRLWQEMLCFHHPRLGGLSGPYSRGYLTDTVGHASNWKILCCFLGIDSDPAVVDLVYAPKAGQVVIPDGDIAGVQSFVSWLTRPDYHVPDDIQLAFEERRFPYTYRGTYQWPGMGFQRANGKVFLNVEGDWRTPGGRGVAQCYQDERFSIGSMTQTYTPQNHACQVIYRLSENENGLGATRTATLAMTVEQPKDGMTDRCGKTHMVSNYGCFQTKQKYNVVSGSAVPHHWAMQSMQTGGDIEIGFNLLVSEHLPAEALVESVCLNDQCFPDEPLTVQDRHGQFQIEDGGVSITCSFACEDPMRIRITRSDGFLRCAVVLYEGPVRTFTPDELACLCVNFTLSVQCR